MRNGSTRRAAKGKPVPLLEWQPPLARQTHIRRRPILIVGGIGLALLGLTATLDFAIRPAPRLIWNASASAPIGLWRVHPGARVRTGDMVLAWMPDGVRGLAAQRRYLPVNVPLLKRVAARDGDEICALGRNLYVNGQPLAVRRAVDRHGRPLPWWSGCIALRDNHLLLLMDAADSFDGRYFGPISEDAVIGKAVPLWLR
ncbi:S26 family signal peptidase [Sphingobium sp. YR768]|uniref:S26 family signal peptidase n=1 Tax=Sphingobium sp. YR768 TaxID=1884365 RepID=UPI0008AE4D28|nr:S26 family signal peptidase [Sphingobium sp. YR768]SER23201.1 conjugative transfer signal peptidase TraF [Sphingobium sp. YR768]